MNSRDFLGLKATHNPNRWYMEVVHHLQTPGGFLFGGCGLGAAIAAMEDTSGRECVWATGQYLSYARSPEVMDIDVVLAVTGHNMTQARAVCHVGDREILTVNAALGHRPFDRVAQFEEMPDVPPPNEVAPHLAHRDITNTIKERVELRLIKGRSVNKRDGTLSDGQSLLWSRLPDVTEGVDASVLATMADLVPMGIGQSLGVKSSGNSLDNTLRVMQLVPTEWVLLDIRIHSVQRGFGHGLVHMFAEDGTLMATASQSAMVRYWKG